MALSVGSTFAGYTVVRQLGAGGMGEVYLAQHPRLPRREALKILRPEISTDATFRQRFIREADSIAALDHPHIVTVFDRGDSEGRLWIATQFVDGVDAARLLRDRYPAGMPADEVTEITTAIGEALDYAHGKGLLHRDVKPANILLSNPDEEGNRRIYLADFGIARPLEDPAGLTATNFTMGTVAYAAPEQLMGENIDGRADQYALAATAYYLLTGSPLYTDTNPVAVISHHLTKPPPPPSAVRPELAPFDAAFARALAKQPEVRFPSCRDFARAIAAAAGSSGMGYAASAPTQQAPTPPVPEPKPPRTTKDRRRLTFTTAAAAIVGVVAAGLLWHPWTKAADQQPVQGASPTAGGPLDTPPVVPSTRPTRDIAPGQPGWPSDPRFLYGVSGPPDIRFAYGVVRGQPCDKERQQFGYERELGGVVVCLSTDSNGYGKWVSVGSWGRFDGVHSQGSLCDTGSTAMSLDGRAMLCTPGSDGTLTWQYGTEPSEMTQPAPAPTPTTPAPSAAASIRYAIPACFGFDQERPKTLQVRFCADGGANLSGLSWTSWGADGADGRGYYSERTCNPSCAQGGEVTYPIYIHASNPAPLPADTGCPSTMEFYNRVTLAFPGDAPAPYANGQSMLNTRYNGMPATLFTIGGDPSLGAPTCR